MPRIIVEADAHPAESGPATLGERVLRAHLEDTHYAAQLIARIRWAAEDAERLEQATGSAPRARPLAVVRAGDAQTLPRIRAASANYD